MAFIAIFHRDADFTLGGGVAANVIGIAMHVLHEDTLSFKEAFAYHPFAYLYLLTGGGALKLG